MSISETSFLRVHACSCSLSGVLFLCQLLSLPFVSLPSLLFLLPFFLTFFLFLLFLSSSFSSVSPCLPLSPSLLRLPFLSVFFSSSACLSVHTSHSQTHVWVSSPQFTHLFPDFFSSPPVYSLVLAKSPCQFFFFFFYHARQLGKCLFQITNPMKIPEILLTKYFSLLSISLELIVLYLLSFYQTLFLTGYIVILMSV